MQNPFAGRGLDLIYIGKVWVASVITYFLALLLEVPQPQTAVISVFILMQPQSGPVIAKSVFRLLGTLIGAVAAVILVSLLGQQGELAILALAIWIGICCAVATRHRGFSAYACVLAGYSAAIVGGPALMAPEDVFISALWRVLEVSLAILCCATVSTVLLPQFSSRALEQALAHRLGHLAGLMCDALTRKSTLQAHGAAQRQLIADAVVWENLSQLVVWEDPRWSSRQGALRRINGELMAVATSLNALLHWIERMTPVQFGDFMPQLEPLAEVLVHLRDQHLLPHEAVSLASRFQELHNSVKAELAADHEQEVALTLLQDLLAGLRRTALSHARIERTFRSSTRVTFEALTSPWLSMAAGIRATMLIAGLGTFWYLSAWPAGAAVLISGAAAVSLASTTPNPRGTGVQMFQGAVVGSVLAFIEYCYVYPSLDGFPLLALALAPPVLYGAWLTTRLQTMGIGLGLLVSYSTVAIPANTAIYDPVWLMDNCLATLLGFACAAVAGSLLLPSNAPWAWKRLQQALTEQGIFTVTAPLRHLRHRLESRTRDMLQHASALAASSPEMQRKFLDTTLAAQMRGLAIIEVRQALLKDHAGEIIRPILIEVARGNTIAIDSSLQAIDGDSLGHRRARAYLSWLRREAEEQVKRA